jgi:hypothetical protein
MGLQMRQLLTTPCVALSLTLVALGGSDLSGRFRLRTLSIGRHHDNRGARFGYGCHIRDVEGVHMRSRLRHKLIFVVPFYHACRAQPLCLLGYYRVGL